MEEGLWYLGHLKKEYARRTASSLEDRRLFATRKYKHLRPIFLLHFPLQFHEPAKGVLDRALWQAAATRGPLSLRTVPFRAGTQYGYDTAVAAVTFSAFGLVSDGIVGFAEIASSPLHNLNSLVGGAAFRDGYPSGDGKGPCFGPNLYQKLSELAFLGLVAIFRINKLPVINVANRAERQVVGLATPPLFLEYEDVLKRAEHRLVHGLTLEEIDEFFGGACSDTRTSGNAFSVASTSA